MSSDRKHVVAFRCRWNGEEGTSQEEVPCIAPSLLFICDRYLRYSRETNGRYACSVLAPASHRGFLKAESDQTHLRLPPVHRRLGSSPALRQPHLSGACLHLSLGHRQILPYSIDEGLYPLLLRTCPCQLESGMRTTAASILESRILAIDRDRGIDQVIPPKVCKLYSAIYRLHHPCE